MEIQVGEYIRTKDGYIRKIIEDFSTDNSYFKLDKEKLAKYDFTYFYSDEIFKKEIKNHSFNIIDLIEEGDYVNGQKVVGVSNVSGWIDTKEDVIHKDHIKSIVTKEMFQNIEYRVESN